MDLGWYFFVLTQKSTQKKSRQKDASSRIPSHPRLFVGPAHLSFLIHIPVRDFVSMNRLLFSAKSSRGSQWERVEVIRGNVFRGSLY